MEIQKLIAGGESEQVEFKSTLQYDVRQRKREKELRREVLKTIVAFLNTRGGTLLIGVEDDGTIHGLEDDLKLLHNSRDKFQQFVSSLIKEHIGAENASLIRSEIVEVEGKPIYVIQVSPAPPGHEAFLRWKNDDEFFIRSGTTTQLLSRRETHEYIQRRQSGGHAPSIPQGERRQVTAMRAFHTIAVPHEDILEGRLTLDTFAADLWEVFQGRAPAEYRDVDLFFDQTYLTQGMSNLLRVVKKRLDGQGGDPVIQIQTPFGGGKTHSLIALYHRARKWGAKRVVIVGTTLSGKETLWGLIAEQLQGSREGFEGLTAPGREALRQLLAAHQPVLILMDEVLQYITKAASIPVGQSTLAAQTMAFMQELTEAVATLEKAALVVTLPSSRLEHYDEAASRFFAQLKKVSGRVEKLFTPVRDNEVGAIIRKRLFSHVDKQAAEAIIDAYIEQAIQESLLSRGEEQLAYRERFKRTYPFLPEVVEVLYHRWGSFPDFQRTRGTLRLLALVIANLKRAQRPYITLADFDLGNEEIRSELLRNIADQYKSVLAADITGDESGAVRVNREINRSYQGLELGKRIATTIFMYSFIGGGGEAGATVNEIKRQNLQFGVPASVITDVLQKLSNRLLFFLHEEGGRYYFSTTANLNRMLTVRMENISDEVLREAERMLIKQSLRGDRLKTYIWPEASADIPDNDTPKLIILPQGDKQRMTDFIAHKGQTPRVHRNTLFFLTPKESERFAFEQQLRRYEARLALQAEKRTTLGEKDRERLARDIKRDEQEVKDLIAHLYRHLYLPEQDGLRQMDLGMPTYGVITALDERAYEALRQERRLVERLAPMVVKSYLDDKAYLLTRQLAEQGSRTPGKVLPVSRRVWEESIAEGVWRGLFGLGEVDAEGTPHCRYFKERVIVSLEDPEVIIRAEICQRQIDVEPKPPVYTTTPTIPTATISESAPAATVATASEPLLPPTGFVQPSRQSLTLRFTLPFGQVSSLLGLLNLLQTRFNRMEITIRLREGNITEAEIEDKVRETFRQMGTEIEIE